MTDHPPQPWTASDDCEHWSEHKVILDRDQNHIAVVKLAPFCGWSEDAVAELLIAAPEMLNVLERVSNDCASLDPQNPPHPPHPNTMVAVIDILEKVRPGRTRK